MHQFPPASELQFLVGREIGQVCLDPFSVQFRFADDGQITVEHRIEHIDRDFAYGYNCQAEGRPALYLHRLLGQRIVSLDVEPLCLTLTFANGAVLRIHSEVGPYESGQICPSEDWERLIVF